MELKVLKYYKEISNFIREIGEKSMIGANKKKKIHLKKK